MNYIVLDLEATCWDFKTSIEKMEVIEFGAVMLEPKAFIAKKETSIIVKPSKNPQLSDFCIQLTSINQNMVDKAETFPAGYNQFLEWIGKDQFILLSWGNYDWLQLESECKRHSIEFPPQNCVDHINLKEIFASYYGTKVSIGFKSALNKIGIQFKGRPHRGIDDARNIAEVTRHLRPLIIK